MMTDYRLGLLWGIYYGIVGMLVLGFIDDGIKYWRKRCREEDSRR